MEKTSRLGPIQENKHWGLMNCILGQLRAYQMKFRIIPLTNIYWASTKYGGATGEQQKPFWVVETMTTWGLATWCRQQKGGQLKLRLMTSPVHKPPCPGFGASWWLHDSFPKRGNQDTERRAGWGRWGSSKCRGLRPSILLTWGYHHHTHTCPPINLLS